jgi:hypothetical protein
MGPAVCTCWWGSRARSETNNNPSRRAVAMSGKCQTWRSTSDSGRTHLRFQRIWHVQRISSGGSAERELRMTIRHSDSPSNATARVLLARVY